MHSNVLGNRESIPPSSNSESEKRHHQSTEQRLAENQPHQQARADLCAENASRTDGRPGVASAPPVLRCSTTSPERRGG